MTILITGGAGYIGSHAVHELIDAGERVMVLDNLSTGLRAAVPNQVKLVVGDAGDQALVSSLIDSHHIDAIIHFAGSIIVPDSVKDPLSYYRNNTVNSHALIEAAIKGGVRHFIFSSTAAVYGNPSLLAPVAEDAPLAPMSPYGWSKLMTEVMLRDAGAAHRLGYVILRYFNVAGADPQQRTGHSTPNATHLIKVAVQAALKIREVLEIFGNDYLTPDGTCVRDYIHVTDLVSAHLAALHYLRNEGASTTLNCGYGRGYSVLEVVEAVERICGRSLPVRVASRRPGDPMSIVADARRIREALGWMPKWDNLDKIVSHALAWERHLKEAGGKSRRQTPIATAR